MSLLMARGWTLKGVRWFLKVLSPFQLKPFCDATNLWYSEMETSVFTSWVKKIHYVKKNKTYNKRLGLNLIYAPLFYHGSLNKYRYLHINVVDLFPIKPINIFEFYHNITVTEDLVLNLSFISQQFLYLQAYRKTIFPLLGAAEPGSSVMTRLLQFPVPRSSQAEDAQ